MSSLLGIVIFLETLSLLYRIRRITGKSFLRRQISRINHFPEHHAYNPCVRRRPSSGNSQGPEPVNAMQPFESISIESARRSFAEDLCRLKGVSSPAILAAFATVPRERFAGPGPWMIQVSGARSFTESSDPSKLYQDALILLDAAKRLNNGQPSLWALHLSLLDVRPGDHILHLGCGAGYYSAILAELVGPSGYASPPSKSTEPSRIALASLSSLGLRSPSFMPTVRAAHSNQLM